MFEGKSTPNVGTHPSLVCLDRCHRGSSCCVPWPQERSPAARDEGFRGAWLGRPYRGDIPGNYKRVLMSRDRNMSLARRSAASAHRIRKWVHGVTFFFRLCRSNNTSMGRGRANSCPNEKTYIFIYIFIFIYIYLDSLYKHFFPISFIILARRFSLTLVHINITCSNTVLLQWGPMVINQTYLVHTFRC